MLDYHSVSLWQDITVVAVLHPPLEGEWSWREPQPTTVPNPYEHTVYSHLRLFTLQSNMYVSPEVNRCFSKLPPLKTWEFFENKYPKNGWKNDDTPPCWVWVGRAGRAAGSAAGLASLAGMLPCGLRKLLAQRRVKSFPRTKSWDEGRIEGSWPGVDLSF